MRQTIHAAVLAALCAPAAFAQSEIDLTGYWGGMTVCADGRGFANFHQITRDGGGLVSDYFYFGSNASGGPVRILRLDTSEADFLFDVEGDTFYDYTFRVVDGDLVSAPGTYPCSVRLTRISEDEFKFASVLRDTAL